MTNKFAERLNNLLYENNITKYRLAKETGISQANISRWENGEFFPTSIFALSLRSSTVFPLTNL